MQNGVGDATVGGGFESSSFRSHRYFGYFYTNTWFPCTLAMLQTAYQCE